MPGLIKVRILNECRYEARWQAAQAAKKPANPPADVTPKEPAKPGAAANTAASIAETMKPLQVWVILRRTEWEKFGRTVADTFKRA
jgi:hypothetical protein